MSDADETERGVYYNERDYASLPVRFLVAGVDLAVIALFAFLVSWIWSFRAEPPNMRSIYRFGWTAAAVFYPAYYWIVTGSAYVYLTAMKRSNFKTLGYRIFGIKVVNLKGTRPSMPAMSWRFILLTFGPLDVLADLLWLGGEETRQTIRDKFAGTYVIKASAVPAGTGRIVYERYNFMGFAMIFKNIKRSK